jgi:periplasmic protein TonB
LTISSAPPEQGIVPRRIQVDGATQAKSLVYRLKPEIPPAAKAAGVSGTVVLHAVISTDGRPRDLEYVSGPPLLAQAAIDAVKWWGYRVAVVDAGTGTPVEVDTTMDVVFSSSPN